MSRQQQVMLSSQISTPLKPMLSAQHNLYQPVVSFSSHKSSAEKIEYTPQAQQQQQVGKTTSTFQHPRAFSASQKPNNGSYFPPPSSVSPIKPPRNPSLDSASKIPFPQHDKNHPPYPTQQNINVLSNITPFNPPQLVCSPGTFQSSGIPISYQVKSQSPSIQSQQQYQSLKQPFNQGQNIVKGSDGINNIQQQRSANIQNNMQSQAQQNILSLQTYNNTNQNIKTQNLPQNLQNQSQKGNIFQQDEVLQHQQQVLQQSDQEDINEGPRIPPQESSQGRGGMLGSIQQSQEEAQSGKMKQSLPIVYKNNSRLNVNNQILGRNIGSSTQNAIGSQFQPITVQSQQQQHWNGGQYPFQQQINPPMLVNPMAGNSYHVQPLLKAQIQGGSVLSSSRGTKKDNQKVETEQIADKVMLNELEEAKNEIIKLQKIIEETNQKYKIKEEKTNQAIKKLEEDNVQLVRLVETLEQRIVEMAEAQESAATTGRMKIESQRQENQKYQQESQRYQLEIQNLKDRESILSKQVEEYKQGLGQASQHNQTLEEKLTGMKQQLANLQEEKEDMQAQLLLVNRQLENQLEDKSRQIKSDNLVEGEGHMGSYLQSLLREKDKEIEEQRQKIVQIINDQKDFEILVTDQKDVMTQLEEKVSLLQLENNKLLEIIDVQNNISQHNNNQQQSFHQQQQQEHGKQEQLSLNAGNSEQMGREQFNSNDYRVISEMEAKLQNLADDNQRLGSSAEQFKQQAQYWKESFEQLQGQQLQEQQNSKQQQQQPQPAQQQPQQAQQSQVQTQSQAQSQNHSQQQSSQQFSQYNQSQQSSQQQQMQRQSVQYQQQPQQQQQITQQMNQQFYQPVLLQPARNQQIIQLKLTPRQQGTQQQQVSIMGRNTPALISQSTNLSSSLQQQTGSIYQSRQSLRQQVEDQRQPTISSPNRTQQPPISSGSPSPWNANSNIQLLSQPIKELSHSWYYPVVPSQEQLRQVQQGQNQTPSKLLPPSYAPPRRFASADKQGKISFS